MGDDDPRLRLPLPADLYDVRRVYRELARRCRPSVDHRGGTAQPLASLHYPFAILNESERRTGTVQRPRTQRAGGREPAFVDEVDIDFPSVSGLVGRIRRSFFGATPTDPLSAEVRLTATQAGAGVQVPLDVSLRHTCPACGGRGEVWLDPCGACGGSGAGLLPHQLKLAVPPGVRNGTCLRFDVTPPHGPSARVQVRIVVQ